MKRNFMLPSENLKNYQHDCRLESLKFRMRSKLYDVNVLSGVLKKTNNSLCALYNTYLSHPEDLNKLNNDSIDLDVSTGLTSTMNQEIANASDSNEENEKYFSI